MNMWENVQLLTDPKMVIHKTYIEELQTIVKYQVVLNITVKYHPGLAHEPHAAHLAEVVPEPGPALVILVVRVAAAPLVGVGQHEAVHVLYELPVVCDDPGQLVRGGGRGGGNACPGRTD